MTPRALISRLCPLRRPEPKCDSTPQTDVVEQAVWVFEWDEEKRQANLVKHGLDFADALEVYRQPRQYREERRQIIGRVGEHVVFVVYTVRGEGRRVISARRANKDERRAYLASGARG